MQTLRKKTSPCKYRNDPGRFFGDGVQFKAKLIGILEVGEARGDRMCQEALQDLKMAIRAAGEHKQRITIHVTIDGLRLRDEKTGDSLYHHPVHKISFIAQDMTDSRAFGYIFGSPDSGHRFFGIKTDKAASQVVLAMRDLFQVVFELKKKEIELARQQIQSKSIHEHHLASLSSLKSGIGGAHNDLNSTNASASGGGGGGGVLSTLSGLSVGSNSISRLGVNVDAKGMNKEMSPESVADLVDLEQELSSIQRGITQMERITPNDPSQPHASSECKDEDPFGDSFTNFPHAYNLLPPPESGRSRSKPLSKSSDILQNNGSTTSAAQQTNVNASQNIQLTTLLSPAPVPASSNSPAGQQDKEDDSWLNELDAQNDVFDTSSKRVGSGISLGSGLPLAPLAASESTSTPTQQLSENSVIEDVVCISGGSTAAISSIQMDAAEPISASASASSASATAKTDVIAAAGDTLIPADAIMLPRDTDPFSPTRKKSDPFQDGDIFSKLDPFEFEFSSSSSSTTAQQNANENAANAANAVQRVSPTTPANAAIARRTATTTTADNVFNGPLQVSLPPERGISPLTSTSTLLANAVVSTSSITTIPPTSAMSSSATTAVAGAGAAGMGVGLGLIGNWKSDITRLERQSSLSPTITTANSSSLVRSRPTPSSSSSSIIGNSITISTHPHATSSSVFKQQTVDVISSISNKKMPHLFGQARFSKRGGDSNTINMRRLQESDSLSENETAPEPPPRPDSALHVEPPPLPPKKQFNEIVIRPRVTSGNAVSPPASNISLSTSQNRYEFLSTIPSSASSSLQTATASATATDVVPPIPLPSRRIGRSDGSYPGPVRPRKPGHTEDDYLAPLGLSSAATTTAAANATAGVGIGGGGTDLPPLLPPPTQTSTRGQRAQRQQSLSYKPQELYENKTEALQQHDVVTLSEESASSILPDITLSQLLTLGIDELALKLNVPTSKLSTMTLVELTSYLSEFIEKSNPPKHNKAASNLLLQDNLTGMQKKMPEMPSSTTNEDDGSAAAIFKVDFNTQGTFVAKFDDTFGEDIPRSSKHDCSGNGDSFVANFEKFNEPPVAPPILSKAGGAPAIPSADRYAVFREIIDKELEVQKENVDLIGIDDVLEPPAAGIQHSPNTKEDAIVIAPSSDVRNDMVRFSQNFDENDDFLGGGPQTTHSLAQSPHPMKIDTKITEVVAQAKDRYAALRDIILVENLFDKKPPPPLQSPPDNGGEEEVQDYPEFGDKLVVEDQDPIKQIMKNRLSSGRDRLLDSRSLPAEPSSSAVATAEDDDDEEDDDEGGGEESSLDSNDKESAHAHGRADHYEMLSTSTQQLDIADQCSSAAEKPKTLNAANSNSSLSAAAVNKQDSKFLTVANSSALSTSKDDLEIDELMQRAISNLSLDSRERISPAVSSSAALSGPRSTSATLASTQSPITTSGIHQRSPVSLIAPVTHPRHQHKSPQISPVSAPLAAVSNLIDAATKQMSSTASIGSTGGSELLGEPEGLQKEAWATFESPKTIYPEVNVPAKRGTRICSKSSSSKASAATLHLPPAPPSNTSQNDTAESPCSSDPRDDGGGGVGGGGAWNKERRWPKARDRQQTSSSSRDLSPWDDDTAEYHTQKQQQQQRRMMANVGAHAHSHPAAHAADRHEYYAPRHTARRMNSCDEDYDYDEEMSTRRDRDRDHRKFNKGLSRSRDNFELESPSWYHHPAHHTWSPQDVEQAAAAAAGTRMRPFERSAYERTTYGPPIYDKRVGGGNASSSYDRRTGFEKQRKYYREYGPRPNYEFEEYGESPNLTDRYRDVGGFEKPKMGRRSDYENVYDDGRSPMSSMMYGGSRARADYAMYERERERKSFDRDSVESFESSTRRRRSFGSGEVYGSLESREEFRERYMGSGGGAEKTRSLRKGMKLRATGDIDYEQDSENDFHQRPRAGPGSSGGGGGGSSSGIIEPRSLQRPSQLVSNCGGGGGMSRMRKSSGSSPWDGEEPPLPGQKSSWKRPGSATESERRLAESRRAAAIGQTPSGSEGEKDRRFRKKSRTRGKEYLPPTSTAPSSSSRYGGNYDTIGPNSTTSAPYQPSGGGDDIDDDNDDDDYVDEDYDEPPTDEDKFERLNRRRLEMNQRMLESERRQYGMNKCSKGSSSVGPSFPPIATPKRYHHQHCAARGGGGGGGGGGNIPSYEIDDYDEQTPTPRSNTSSIQQNSSSIGGINTKFSFDGGGFESDFNQSSPPPAPAGTASSCTSTPAAVTSAANNNKTSSFRFSNDFSDRDKLNQLTQNSTSISSLQQFELDVATSPGSHATSTSTTQKLRFDDNVKVSQFDDAAFEDDFSKAPFDFTKSDDDWKQQSDQQQQQQQIATMQPSIGGGVGSGLANHPTSTVVTSIKKQHLRNSKMQQRQELIKKSESINIFAKKAEDPFEDDEFFKAPKDDNQPPQSTEHHSNDKRSGGGNGAFQWQSDNNFAKFDENM